MEKPFYSVLCVEPEATLEEIKLAFKRRALQVHPDKGGSKEAFHLVYQAFETLADPEARRRYDQLNTPKKMPARQKAQQKAQQKTKKATFQAKSAAEGSSTAQNPGDAKESEASKSSHAKMLTKLYQLLTRLARDVRNEVIQKEFSQKQRLLLEEWIVNQRDAEKRSPAAVSTPKVLEHGNACDVDAAPCSTSSLCLVPTHQKQPGKRSKRRRKELTMRGIYSSFRGEFSYFAQIVFDGIVVTTGKGDLPTALEFLVILTSIKQKMQGVLQDSEESFKSHMEEAIVQAAIEHGRKCEDLNLRFSLVQKNGFFLSTRMKVRSPTVRTIRELAKLRSSMAPFRECVKQTGGIGRGSMIWHYSPQDLESLWKRLQDSVAEMWEGRSAPALQRMRSCFDSNAEIRNRQLKYWEREHMAMHDKNKHRPRRLRAVPQLRWERRHMAMHDKKAPKKRRQDRKPVVDVLVSVRKLLLRWRNQIHRQEKLAEMERQKLLRQRQRDRRERKRLEALKRKRAKEEQKAERLRREALRKKMMSPNLTMDDILGSPDAQGGKKGSFVRLR